jgi:hypothetical protein
MSAWLNRTLPTGRPRAGTSGGFGSSRGAAATTSKGLPPVNEMVLEGPNGQVMTFGRIQAAGSESPTG